MSRLDPYEELAGLYLTEPDGPTTDLGSQTEEPMTGGGGPSPRCRIELLVVGHLPVRAGLWLPPYANAVASAQGPTALVRLDDSNPSMQLLGRHPMTMDQIQPGLTLRQVIDQLAGHVRCWIVRPTARQDSRELVRSGAHAVTILCSANEAARVDTYQLVKEVVQAAEQTHQSLPELSLAIMGCDQSTAQRVFRGLNETTRSFLGTDLQMAACLPKMDSALVSSGYREFPGEEAPNLKEIMHQIDRASTGQAPTATASVHEQTQQQERSIPVIQTQPASAPPPSPIPMPRPQPASDPMPGPRPGDAPGPIPPPLPAASIDAETLASEAVAQQVPPPTVEEGWTRSRTYKYDLSGEAEVEAKIPGVPREPSREGKPVPLCDYVEGLNQLPIRCPNHELIEIGVTKDGQLHLLGPAASLREMHIVGRWAVDHRELIGMACPDSPIDALKPARMHLFTDNPLAVADLHGSDLNLHLLARVRVGQEVGWFASPLNATR